MSKVEEVSGELRVVNPWGDNSLAFGLTDETSELVNALNNVRLHPRLSGIYHKKTSDLEIIWTAFRLAPSQKDIATRNFNFEFKKMTYTCEFGDASQTVLDMAKRFIPVLNSPTNFRNLYDISNYVRFDEDDRKAYGFDRPRSFWIRNIKWDEEKIVGLVNNLNFYLTYYDERSPQILVHDPVDDSEKTIEKTRYVIGAFPEQIDARELDTNLLAFWNNAERGNPMMRFLLYYRIIEYAATHYVDSKIRTEIHKIILAPTFRADIPSAIEKIAGAFSPARLDDTQKFEAVVRNCVDSKLLWRDVKANKAFFSKDTTFEGGFKVNRIIDDADTETTFCVKGHNQFSKAVRQIRNALAHGKDQETAGVITPSTRNVKLFLPWVHLIATAAGEVVLLKDAT